MSVLGRRLQPCPRLSGCVGRTRVLCVPAAGDPAVAGQLLGLLSSSVSAHPGVCAYVAGLLWELAALSAAAEQLLAAGAVSVLLQVVRATAAAIGSSGGKKKHGKNSKGSSQKAARGGSAKQQAGKADASSSGKGNAEGKDAKGAVPEGADAPAFVLLQDPQAAAQVALCNATGDQAGWQKHPGWVCCSSAVCAVGFGVQASCALPVGRGRLPQQQASCALRTKKQCCC